VEPGIIGQHTDAPAVMGISISKTIIRAVKMVASGTGSVGGHKTLPIFKWTGSTAVKYSVALEPAAAHGTLSSSTSIATSFHQRRTS
jgi:hypothetical protein